MYSKIWRLDENNKFNIPVSGLSKWSHFAGWRNSVSFKLCIFFTQNRWTKEYLGFPPDSTRFFFLSLFFLSSRLQCLLCNWFWASDEWQASHNPKVSFQRLPYYLFPYVFSLHFGVEFKYLCKYIKRAMIAFSIALSCRWLEKSSRREHSLPLKNGATLSAYLTPCGGFCYCS